MTTFTEIVAAVVVHSSAAAYSHFGVVLEPSALQKPQLDRPRAERVIARSPLPRAAERLPADKLTVCPDIQSRTPRASVKA
ncbi:hypothetical protein [Phenylobacterium immobile]|uniref:hypothetical protein n=1 Tax=Phenylobacterium immobile TaxID=21 RepID=UPI000ABD306D|nr:hypothetical protein [Phenylobacterium immobile]